MQTWYKVNGGEWTLYPSGGFTVTNSATIYYKSEDNVGNVENEESQEIKIDKTAPSTPVVTDDGDYTNSKTELHASWESVDPESGVAEFKYAIGDTQGGNNIVDWTSVGTDTEVTAMGLTLTVGETYYFSVQAENNAGLLSNIGYSNGIEVISAVYVPDDYSTIQEAIDEADPGDTVIVKDDTYTGSGNVDLDFGGKAITVRSENGPASCIIDCEETPGTRGFYFHSGETSSSVVIGFTIQGGRAIGSWPINSGGGILCSSSSPIIRGNVITGNSATMGGGIACVSASPAIEGNIITGNSASSDGGGIYLSDSSATMKNNLVTGNSSDFGGAFYCADNSSFTVVSNTIADNVSNTAGGTYYYDNSSATLVNTILWNNSPQEVWFSGSGNPCSISISYSDIKGGESGIVTNSNGTVTWGTGNIDEDPLFASYSLSDFSPCIGAGVMTPDVPTTDIGGVARPTPPASNPDMGAYENSRSEPGYIDLTSPDGSEVWCGGASHDITWTSAGSGIDHIRIVYSTDSGSTYPHTIISNTPNDGIYEWSVSMENSTTVRVKVIAEDSGSNELISDASNANLTIDSIAPETVISPPDGTPGENGWYLSDVTITLSATDNLSGVKEIKYKIDDGIWQIYPAGGITVTGSNVFYYRAEDNAGNLESEKSIEVKIDKTSPPKPVVIDDGVYTNSTTQLHAWWASDDPESGIEKYEYAIGTTQGGDDVVGWTSIGKTVSGISMNVPEGSILSGGSMIDLLSVDGEVTVTGLSLVDGQIYYFSVRAKNNAGLWSGDGYSDGITVDVDVEQKELHLYTGWNLISLCLNTGDNTLSSVLQPISGLYRSVWFYDAASGNWRRYVPDGPALPGDLNSLEVGEGYWIDMVEDATLTITGQEITSMSVQLYPGWNMVGYSLSDDKSLGDALFSIADKYNCILTYDSMTGSWSGYIPGVPVPPNSLDHLESCSGYWISAKENCLWNVGL
jgi:parallel beta-helix repeat protein